MSNQQKDMPELNFEKSKKSLAEIEEEKLRKRISSLKGEKSQKEILQDKIDDLFKLICYSIDNMSRLSFTPLNKIE